MAKELGLLPESIEWQTWTPFMESFLEHVNLETLDSVAGRYQFGELRLTRLNAIYKFTYFSFQHWIRGYMSSSTWYRAFFAKNFAWLLIVFAFVSVVLSAMQVGLATTSLQTSTAFQSASYGFAVASLVVVLCGVVLAFLVWAILFVYHLVSTWNYYRAVSRRRINLCS